MHDRTARTDGTTTTPWAIRRRAFSELTGHAAPLFPGASLISLALVPGVCAQWHAAPKQETSGPAAR